MKRVLVTVAAVAATAVVGTAVPLGLTLSASGTTQAPAATIKVDAADRQGPPSWAKQKPGDARDAAKARWKKDRKAHLEAWKAWKRQQQEAWRGQDSHDGKQPPWAGGPWRTGPGSSR